jgi:hypothetical protein
MNAKIIPLILFTLLLSTIAAATSGNEVPEYDRSTGTWSVANPATYGADYNYANYALCNATINTSCMLLTNFSLGTPGFYNSIIWGVNISDVVNGENIVLEPDCTPVSGTDYSVLIEVNASATPNTTMYCLDQTVPYGTWIPVHAGNFGNAYKISGQYMYWTDNAPTVVMDDSINGSTKPCNEDYTRSSDIIFTATDNTDTEFECCIGIDGSYDLASCNSSIQNNTQSVLHTDRIIQGTQTVDVRCQDENGYGYSNSMTLIGEDCSCDTNSLGDFIKFAVLIGIMLFFAAYFFGGTQFFEDNWKYVAMLIAASLILWWMQNWNAC